MNIITGLNGAGKTNLLDAIYYLCLCKSYFQPTDSINILHGEAFFRLEGHFTREKNQKSSAKDVEQNVDIANSLENSPSDIALESPNQPNTPDKTTDIEAEKPKLYNLDDNGNSDKLIDLVTSAYMKGRKKVVERNKVPYKKYSEHIGYCPVVIIEPDDVQLIRGGSSNRRSLIDSTLSQFNPAYLETLIQYERSRKQRNALLKQMVINQSFDGTLLDTYDLQLCETGPIIYEHRKKFLAELNPIFQKYYTEISAGREKVNFVYASEMHKTPLLESLQKSRERDRILKRTTAGIHVDDWLFRIGDYDLKKLGSQGQKKSFLIALKLAIYQYIKEKKQQKPFLLLDDIFDKLDTERTQMLLKMVVDDNFGQIFITDTSAFRLKTILETLSLDFKHFEVDDGIVKSLTTVQKDIKNANHVGQSNESQSTALNSEKE